MHLRFLNDEALFFLPVPEAPPQNVTGYNISQSEILVSWGPVPTDKVNGIVTEYSVRYLEIGRNNSKHKVFNSSVSKGVVDGLKPFTIYSLSVSASTVKGQGPFSIGIHVKTEEEGWFIITIIIINNHYHV